MQIFQYDFFKRYSISYPFSHFFLYLDISSPFPFNYPYFVIQLLIPPCSSFPAFKAPLPDWQKAISTSRRKAQLLQQKELLQQDSHMQRNKTRSLTLTLNKTQLHVDQRSQRKTWNSESDWACQHKKGFSKQNPGMWALIPTINKWDPLKLKCLHSKGHHYLRKGAV